MKNWKMKMRYMLPAVTVSSAVMAFPAFAAGEGVAVSPTDWGPVLSALMAQITVAGVVSAIAAFIAAGIGLVFMWWGVRKLVRTLMAAFKKGRLSV